MAGKTPVPLKRGEIIRIFSLLGLLSDGIYRVEESSDDMLSLSAGEIYLRVNPNFIKIQERDLAPPTSWLEREIEILEAQLKRCDCTDCRRQLVAKAAKLAEHRSGGTPTPLH